jgi:hypothetical protein
MAAEGSSQLTEAHRRGQIAIGARTVVQMGAASRLLDPEDLDGTFPDWLSVVGSIVAANRAESSRLSAGYLQALRELELGESFDPVLAAAADPQGLAVSMLVCGVISLRNNLARAMPLERATEIADERSSAAAMRWSLNGGRETITNTVRADPRAPGWQRVASATACEFCSMLAGRGAVYGEDTADFQAHDGCSCAAEPVYR